MADGYISQIKTPDNKIYDFRDQHLKVYTGSCTTAAGTAIKDVTTDGEFTLAKGAVIFVNFSTTNTAAVANLKLRVNSNAANDAKPIKHEYNASEANLPGAGYLRANQTYQFYYDGTNWVTDVGRDANSTYSYMRPYENTGKGSYNSQGENPVKTGAAGWRFQLSAGKYFMYSHYYDNTAKSALTLNIGSTGAKPIYINGQPSSADNYTLPGGQYLVYYDGTNYYFRTDDKMTGNITGNAATASSIALSGVTGADDLKAIEAISGTTGLLKKTAANTWTLDTNTYLTTHRTYTAVSGKKPTGNQTPGFGSTFDIEQVGQDTTGQVSVTERTVKIPDTAASASVAGLVNTDAQIFGGIKTFMNGIEIKGHIAGDSGTSGHGLWGGGGYHNAYNNIILHGDATTGTSGIAFVSDKGTTTINQPSDRAFIQWHAHGVTTYSAEGTNPTLATSGESNILMIGVGNDATDQIRLQTPGRTGLLHQVGNTGYVIPDTNNTTGSVGGTTTPIYVEAGVIKAGTALGGAAYKAENYYALSSHNHDSTYSYTHLTDYDFTDTRPLSKYVTFDKYKPVGAPKEEWYNGFISSHSNYHASYIINGHTNQNEWYVGHGIWREANTPHAPAPTWYLLAHSGNVGTGDNNGQVKIAGVNISVKGLGSAAYTETSTYAASSHNHNASDINAGTLNTARLPDDVVKKRTGLSASTTETDLFSLIPGMYDHTSSGVNNALPTGYGTILNIAGSYYYGALIAAETNNSLYYRAYYYQDDEHEQWRGNWQMVAHADSGTAIGGAKIPVYVNATGVITAGDALKALAYKDSLVASDIPNLSWSKITSDKPTTLSGYGITDAASSSHSHTLKIGNKSLSVSTSEQEWDVHDILYNPSHNIGTDTSWDITEPGVYSVGSNSAFTGEQNPSSNGDQFAPYTYGHAFTIRAGNGGASQFYINHRASESKHSSRGIRYRSGWAVTDNSYANRWCPWATILDDKNFNLYAPTLTGTGASGSWGISVTGTAANVTGTVAIDHGGTGATSAENARTNLNTVTGNARVFYGTCATAAATTLKEVICAQYDKVLTIGDMLIVKFDNTNSGAVGSLQITVKNSTSDSAGTTAKNIKRQYNSTGANNLVATGELNKDSIAVFVYNGTYWILTNADYNNTYSYDWTTGAGGNGRTAETAANGGVGIHRYSLQMMTLNLTWSSLSSDHPTAATTNGAATDKTVATCGFLLDSPIIYQDTNANAIPGNSANVNGYTTGSINLQYSTTNAQWSALTIQKPVYLIGTLQSDGTFKLNATKWWTQTLPTSDDGQIYIFLGMAYSATNIYLHDAHPIYWYKNGEIQPYAGYATATSRAAITTTANAVAYYTNTTGTFGSKASANGALYATSANGALQWGTLPIAQGGTGVTSFTKNQVILSDNTNGTTGLTSRAYSDSTSAGALSNSSTNFVTERDVYFGLPTLNNAHNYTSSSTYYAPTTGGTAGHVLIGAGATTAPAWYGGTVMSGSAAASWITAFNGTTDATATNAAAVTIAGGLGISKKLHVGSTATVLNLTIGSTNEYGDAYTPIYWHEGVPTAVTLTQQCAFTIKSGKSGVKLSHAAITANSYVTQIVVTSGEANLNSAISWTSAAGYIELTCSSTVSGDVTGYIMISRGGEITATATDIT